MKLTSFLMVIAVLAVVVSAVNLFSNLALFSTGYALTDQGNVTLDIVSILDINFTYNIINWGSGSVNTSALDAITLGNWAYMSTDTVANTFNLRGSTVPGWVNQSRGLVLETNSTERVNITLNVNRDAFRFLDNSQGVSPASNFLWRANQVNTDDTGSGSSDGESGTCTGVGTLNMTTYIAVPYVPTPGPTTSIVLCNSTDFAQVSNELEIDFAVNISRNAPTGPKNVTITATVAKVNP
ncbi:MAG TPA: hypothetical protein VJH92_03835 [Candidatus Nanoarchaeia archaeon]|nr:hypothetical protein [Candidatus Nanoarchaeia archaeon]